MKYTLQKFLYKTQKNSIFTLVGIITTIVILIALFFTINQSSSEQKRLTSDIAYRSSLLASILKESIEPDFLTKSNSSVQNVVNRFTDKQRIAGLAVVNNTGKVIALSGSLSTTMLEKQPILTDVMDSDVENGDFSTFDDKQLYIFATPLHEKKTVVGALIVVQNAAYISNQLLDIWTTAFIRLVVQILILSVILLLILRWLFLKPIQSLVTSLQEIRLHKNTQGTHSFPTHPVFAPLLHEVSSMQQSLIKAKAAAAEEAKMSLERMDSPWTDERLKQFTKDILKNRKIFAVSNLEPYIHTKKGNGISYHFPASGLVTAIEPVMEACGGLWIAQGSGDADKLVVDKDDKLAAPPYDPKYTLKRVWLSEEEERGYSTGFSDQALYPLCHMTHTRPVFREDDWEQYKKVNEKFAQTVLEEIKHIRKPVILVQDFQFTLISRLIKSKRPDAVVGLFWHIPWVSAESFSICPWKKEIVDGMLGADLIGFHTQLHCNNFIETVSRELESLIDYEQSTITRNGHTSFIKPFPISIAFSNENKAELPTEAEKKEAKALLKSLAIKTKYIGIGVDRLDYIKGLHERFTAIEIFLDTYPAYKEQCTFIQISSPSETKTKNYIDFAKSVEQEVERINNRFKTRNWKPIVYLPEHKSHKELQLYYKVAHFCLITSLHDGMNLVAKEFVAARNDEKGVLILSQFAGAVKELKDALIINPYNGKQTAEAIYTSLTMKEDEQKKRMRKMRNVIKNYNIYRWSADFLKTLVSLE